MNEETIFYGEMNDSPATSDHAYPEDRPHGFGLSKKVASEGVSHQGVRYVANFENTDINELEAEWAKVELLHKYRTHRVAMQSRHRSRFFMRKHSDAVWASVSGLELRKGSKEELDLDWEFSIISTAEPNPMASEPKQFSTLMEQYRKAVNPKVLGEFMTALLDISARQELQHWFATEARAWLIERRVALAVAIEAAVQIGASGVDTVIASVLSYESAHSQVASVAAQRVRMLQISDPAMRAGIASSLEYWIRKWMSQKGAEPYAILALPSIAPFISEGAATWVAELIGTANSNVAEAAAVAVLDWSKRRSEKDERLASLLSSTLLQRFTEEVKRTPRQQELVGTLVWALGAAATQEHLEDITNIVVRCFQNPEFVEDAAAVRAGRMLYGRFGSHARKLVANQMGGLDSDESHRYEMALMRPALNRWRSIDDQR